MPEELIAWYECLWGSGAGDDPAAIARVEERLAVRLPPLLRAMYARTALRDSQMIHLLKLDALVIRDGVLVFAQEQQACWSWGIPVERLGDENPAVVVDLSRTWKDDLCTLDEFLRFYALTNRPYEPPFLGQCEFERDRLGGDWKPHEVRWGSIRHRLWTNGEAVLEAACGNIGARDVDAVRRAALSLGVDPDDLDDVTVDEVVYAK